MSRYEDFIFNDRRGHKLTQRDICSIDVDDNEPIRVYLKDQGRQIPLGTYPKKKLVKKFW